MNQPIITPQTATLLLAYVHHYICKFLPKRLMGGRHLSILSNWIGQPIHNLRTTRKHPLLAAHLALLNAAKLLDTRSGCWTCTPAAFDWLQADHKAQLELLRQSLVTQNQPAWNETVAAFGLEETLPLDYVAYLTQQLTHQLSQSPPPPALATWLTTNSEQWLLNLPDYLPSHLRFHLHQLGQWQPGQPLCCTSATFGWAAQHGYSTRAITAIFNKATGQPLSSEQMQQLDECLDRVGAYRIRAVTLLSTRQPEQMVHIARQRRFRERIHEQISPRHAIVSSSMSTNLHRWLERQGYGLTPPPVSTPKPDLPDPAYTWLGLRLLTDVAALTGNSLRPSASSLAAAETHLSPTELADLEARADSLRDQLRQAIRGRDAFLPAYPKNNDRLLTIIKQALNQEETIQMAYQSLVDQQPYWREVFPLRLEQWDALYYLYAYCHRAEANRIFRLDRIHNFRLGDNPSWAGS